ncbi:alpha/beta hydrolase [Oxalobacteraceae bacterium]|nr:alpha/beta hydrolase [Oxalobacteraceae bacterium]
MIPPKPMPVAISTDGTHRWHWSLKAGAAALGALLLAAAAGAAVQAWLTAHEQPAPPGRMVEVDGHRMHLHCQGSGAPLIVLESGLSGWSQDWAAVQPQLASMGTVCSYDRAGYAWSEEAPAAKGAVQTMETLRALLRKAGLQGPVLLVGHSYGGLLVQLYAQLHPQEVSGLVLIDSLQHNMYASMQPGTRKRYQRKMNLLTASGVWLAPFGMTRAAGMPASVVLDKLPPAEQGTAHGFAMQSKNYRAMRAEYLSIDAALETARQLAPVPPVPVVVLSTNARSEFPPGWERKDLRKHWIHGQALLADETDAVHITVPDAGHYLQLERPELVVAAVQNTLRRARIDADARRHRQALKAAP